MPLAVKCPSMREGVALSILLSTRLLLEGWINFTVPFLGTLNRSYLMIVLSVARIVVVLPLLLIGAAPASTCAPLMSFLPRAASALALHIPLAVSETAAARASFARIDRLFVTLDTTRSLPRIDTDIEAST